MHKSFIFILLVFASCSINKVEPVQEEEKEQFVSFLIKKGEHSSTTGLRIFFKGALKFKAVFDQTAKYTLSDYHQEDINKLFGFSDCDGHHHQNSARFGWRWLNDELQILAYCYSNGERKYSYITSIDIDKEYTYQISIEKDKYIFVVDNLSVEMDRGCEGNGGTKYYLFPYFGGGEVAPHDILIKINEL